MRFTNDQIKRLASIFDNVGQVILASVIFPVVMLVSWWISLRLERISS